MPATTIDYRALFDASPNPYVLLAPDFTIVDANEAYLRVTGRTRAELVGRNMFEAFPGGPDDPEHASERRLRESLERVVRERAPDTLALIPYAISRSTPAGEVFEERFWSATHTPLLGDDGEVALILQHTVDVTELQRLKSAAQAAPPDSSAGKRAGEIEGAVFHRAQAVQRENLLLDSERRRLRRLFRQAPGFVAFLRGPRHVFEVVNEAFFALVGHRDLIGRTVREAVPEIEEQQMTEALDRAYQSGKPFIGRDVAIRLHRRAGEPPEERFLDLIYQPILRADGSVAGIFVQGHDVTERKRAETTQRLLLDELNHRVKNTLAAVQSIATQTLRAAVSPGAFREDFMSRLGALSHTHNLLSQRNWQGTSLRDLIMLEMNPYCGAGRSRIMLDGPDVQVGPRVALALGMAFHELATNAVKYGALSEPDGAVETSWDVDRSARPERLRIEWRERNGPPVRIPRHRGFGLTMIERGLAYELDGEVGLAFELDGLRCRMEFPLVRETSPA